MYCNVVTAIDKIPTYLLRFNRQYSLRLIIQPPSCTIFRDASLRRTKIERKHFCKLFNTKWPDSYHEALQHAMRVCLIRLRDSTEHV